VKISPCRAVVVAVLAFAASSGAIAQAYPAKPVRILIGQSPGGATDFFARLFALKLNEAWKQPVVVEPRPGAAGSIAAELTAKAAPDGYTLLLSTAGQVVLNPHLTKLSYDPLTDLTPVAYLAGLSLLLVAHPSVPVKTIKELIAYARANPGKLNYGSSGTAGLQHFAGALFAHMTRTDIVHIPYKGGAAALNDLLGGRTQLQFTTLLSTKPHIAAGRVRALAVTTPPPCATSSIAMSTRSRAARPRRRGSRPA